MMRLIWQGTGQGVRRSVVSAAQIIGPVWATLGSHRNPFWGGMAALTAFSIVVLILTWKKVKFTPPTGSGSSEKTPLLSTPPSDSDRHAIN